MKISPLLCAFLFCVTVVFCVCHSALAEENVCGPMSPAEESIMKLQQEILVLTDRLKELKETKGLSAKHLTTKKVQRLKTIAADARLQLQTTSDFQGFVTWMSTNLAGYNKYIQAGSYAAVLARMLPVPYAGQASIFTKFVTQFTVALNNASVSINTYLVSSQKFLGMIESLDQSKPLDQQTLAEVSRFADQNLLKDMHDAQMKLAAVAELSSGTLSFFESVNALASGTDEYLNKARGLFRKDIDPKEKRFLSESTETLRLQAAKFNGKLAAFKELAHKQTASVKSLTIYDELMVDLSGT